MTAASVLARAWALAARAAAFYRQARKAAAYVVTVAAFLVASGVLHGRALDLTEGIIAAAGLVGIYAARNDGKRISIGSIAAHLKLTEGDLGVEHPADGTTSPPVANP